MQRLADTMALSTAKSRANGPSNARVFLWQTGRWSHRPSVPCVFEKLARTTSVLSPGLRPFRACSAACSPETNAKRQLFCGK